MEILRENVSKEYIRQLSQNLYGDMVKAVVDVDKGLLAIDAELHSDLEMFAAAIRVFTGVIVGYQYLS